MSEKSSRETSNDETSNDRTSGRNASPHGRSWPPRSDEAYREEAVAAVGAELADCFARIEVIVLDADGVLTPGNLLYGPRGEALKEFHTHDGLGLVMCRVAGVKLAVLTGRNSEIVKHRATELRFAAIKLGRFDKLAALEEIFDEVGCTREQALYVGDDLIDLPAMYAVRLPVGVPEAPAEVLERCRYVSTAPGGRGAVREVTDLVLKCSGRYGLALRRLADRTWQPRPDETAGQDDPGVTQ